MSDLSEKHDSLWWVAAAPGIWSVHFVACYGVAAVWCAKMGRDAPLSVARVTIYVVTLASLLAILAVALRGLRQYRAEPSQRTDDDSREARHHFVGFTLMTLSGLSAIAIVYEALAAVIIGSCR